ncbi:MAG TPA: hypothetical protein PLV45_10085 [bacterium]|nr:hypothetical protein [bacterium]
MNTIRLHTKRIFGSAFLLGTILLLGIGCISGHRENGDAAPAVRRRPITILEGRRSDTGEYAGSERCAACHDSIYRRWQQSPHARKLAAADYSAPPHPGSCRRCHCTEGDVEEGVGCEACHGPQRRHADHPGRRIPDPCVICTVQKQCIQCHNRSVDPDFHAADDWKRVSHGSN